MNMGVLRYITHPDVDVDPARAVTAWRLNERGRARARLMLSQPWVATIGRIVTGEETKALELAAVLGSHLGVTPEVRGGIGENDRSATGFVPPAEFEALAQAFFARPDASVRGWERAVDAQHRIVAGLADLLGGGPDTGAGDVAVIGHGGVGTLWYCHLAGVPIDRRWDQPGQGHYFGVDRVTARPLHGWLPIDGASSG